MAPLVISAPNYAESDRKVSQKQLGMIGLGRMGDNMVRRLLRTGHACVVHNRQPVAMNQLGKEGAIAAVTLQQMVAALSRPRIVC